MADDWARYDAIIERATKAGLEITVEEELQAHLMRLIRRAEKDRIDPPQAAPQQTPTALPEAVVGPNIGHRFCEDPESQV